MFVKWFAKMGLPKSVFCFGRSKLEVISERFKRS